MAKTQKLKCKSAFERLGINMETLVGYDGEKTIMPPPSTLQPDIMKFFEKLGIDWRTHIDK